MHLSPKKNLARGETDSLKSCITDIPLPSLKSDDLNASEYADALADFIVNADTPVTIGIQGGWGSGKTSLIIVLQEILNSQQKGPVLCVPVNAWENSLFQAHDNKAEVALSLLNDLAEGVEESVHDAKWLPQKIKDCLGENSEIVGKAINGIKIGLTYFGRVGTQMLSNMIGGGDVSNVKVDPSGKAKTPTLAKSVRSLKSGLEAMISKITVDDKPVKIVFFIDDLDRVPPPTAVEVLDLTKNIFNIPNCVFVLAIDYEVVVKGLEEKFGKKTAQNEREFRQYFDKIIQIPFTMPTGVYGDKLDSMLKTAFAHLNLNLGEIDQAVLANLADDARLVTGGNPRSIKRIVNTLSLLEHIARAKARKSATNGQDSSPDLLEARFIIVSMYISYPEICRRLMESPNFTEWNPEKLNLKWKLRLDENRPQLEALSGEEWCNDDWEKVVYCLCTQSEWLKSQARNVSLLLNKLLKVLDSENTPDKPLSEKSQELLQILLESIRVVSVDLEQNDGPVFDDSKVKTDRVTFFDRALQNELAERLPQLLQPATNEYAKKKDREYEIDFQDGKGWIVFNYYKVDETFGISVGMPKPRVTVPNTKKFLKDFLDHYEDEYEYYVDKDIFGIWINISGIAWDMFMTGNQVNANLIKFLADEIVKLLKIAQKAETGLEALS